LKPQPGHWISMVLPPKLEAEVHDQVFQPAV